jgi:NAD-dependent SIR2 family protein deacetylase
MAPRISDHGGNKTHTVKMVKENLLSFRCRECDKLTYRTKRECSRAARPRCNKCGGTLLETATSQDRTTGRQDAKREFEVDKNKAASRKLKLGDYRCPGCGDAYSPEALATHFTRCKFCRDQTVEQELTLSSDNITFMRFTFRRVKMDTVGLKPWAVIAVNADGETFFVRTKTSVEAGAICEIGNSDKGLIREVLEWEAGSPPVAGSA